MAEGGIAYNRLLRAFQTLMGGRTMTPFESSRIKRPRSGKISRFFAHPAVLSVLGGLLVTLVGHYFTAMQASEARKQQIHDKKLAIASNLPMILHREGTLLSNLNVLRAMLKSPAMAGGITRHPAYTSANASLYDQVIMEYIKNGQSSAGLGEVKAWFCSPHIAQMVEDIDQTLETFENATDITPGSVESFTKNLEPKIRRLMQAMVSEVRQEAIGKELCPEQSHEGKFFIFNILRMMDIFELGSKHLMSP